MPKVSLLHYSRPKSDAVCNGSYRFLTAGTHVGWSQAASGNGLMIGTISSCTSCFKTKTYENKPCHTLIVVVQQGSVISRAQ